MVTSPPVMRNVSQSLQKMPQQQQQKPKRSRNQQGQQQQQAAPSGISPASRGSSSASLSSMASSTTSSTKRPPPQHQATAAAAAATTPSSRKSLAFATPTPKGSSGPGSRSSATPSPRASPCYAGSKCYEPPTPESLPKPPTSWMGGTPTKQQSQNPLQALVSSMQRQEQRQADSRDSNEEVSRHLKMLLKVSA